METPVEQILCSVESLQLDMKVAKSSFFLTFSFDFQVKTFLEKDLPLSLTSLGLINEGGGRLIEKISVVSRYTQVVGRCNGSSKMSLPS